MKDHEPATARERNAVLRAEIDAWLAAPEGEADPKLYENLRLRIRGVTRMRDAQTWARRHGLAAVPMGGKLLARRADDADATEADTPASALLAHLGELAEVEGPE